MNKCDLCDTALPARSVIETALMRRERQIKEIVALADLEQEPTLRQQLDGLNNFGVDVALRLCKRTRNR